MEWFYISATLVGILVIATLILSMSRGRRHRARLGPDGVQEMEIVVLGGYTPNVAIVREGVPVRLRFTRLEDDDCSSRVVFSDFKVDRRLQPFRTTAVEFLPPSNGEYLFTSSLGMYRGKLIVEAASRSRRWLPW